MNDALKMQISAFVDGELPDNEAELLLRRLNQDVAMRQLVADYLSIGRHMRRDPELPGMDEMRNRIASALGEESLPAAPITAPQRARYLKPVLGLATAASVALLAVFVLRQSVLPDASELVNKAATGGKAVSTATTQLPADDVVSEELRYMYRRHSASSADFGGNAIITRLVNLELQDGEFIRMDPDTRPAAPAAIDADEPGETPSDDAPPARESKAD